MEAPDMLLESGVTTMTEYHLYHLARYISRLKGFATTSGQQLNHFVDTDLGACLLAAAHVIDSHMKTTGDNLLTALWERFSEALDRFRAGDHEVSTADFESAFTPLCEHCHFDPWKI